MSLGIALQRFFKENRDNPALHVVSEEELGEEPFTVVQSEPRTNLADVVEGKSLEQKATESLPYSGFNYFLDGIQRSRRVAYWNAIPLVFGFTAGCIRRRSEDRLMQKDDCQTKEALFFPFSLVPADLFCDSGIRCEDAPIKHSVAAENRDHPVVVTQAIKDAIDKAREAIETKLIENWCDRAGQDDWLLIDGSLSGFYETSCHDRVVGVIKNHQTRYFEGDDYRRVLTLSVGQRTSVFQPKRGNRRPVYSWYLRLRTLELQEPHFGLIRIEAAPIHESVRMSGRISSWVLAERSPVSLPDTRWDRMIYPIRDCEQYLRSLAPSQTEIQARLFI